MQMCAELQSGPRVAMAGDWSKVKLYRSLHSLGFLYWSIDLLAEGWGNTLGWIFLSLVFCYSYENRNALMALLKWFCKWMCTPESFPVHHQCLWFPQNVGIPCSFFIVLPFFFFLCVDKSILLQENIVMERKTVLTSLSLLARNSSSLLTLKVMP